MKIHVYSNAHKPFLIINKLTPVKVVHSIADSVYQKNTVRLALEIIAFYIWKIEQCVFKIAYPQDILKKENNAFLVFILVNNAYPEISVYPAKLAFFGKDNA